MKLGANAEVFLAEFLGTFALLLSILVTGNVYAIGATFLAVICLISGVSGAHINPAVSLVMYLNGTLESHVFALYMFSQFAGAVSAYYATKMLHL
jgi:aquaporin Z